jgi:hypothetical protein
MEFQPIDWSTTPIAFDDDPQPKPKIVKYCITCEKNISVTGYNTHLKTKRHLESLELMIYRNQIQNDN